jgi:hypothetical protein
MKSARYSCVIILILSLGIISCDNVEKPSLINTGNTAGMQPMPVTPGVSAGAVSAQPATAALNPKHGMPGHRCDIPVGAPLNQPAANTTPVINTTQPAAAVPSINLPQQSVSGATAKLNPKHGEPGHRCDIAVGAPLNSAPATPTINTSSAAAAPVVTAPQLKSVGTPKLNPKHGEPGHRCDIAVGAPL